MEEKLLCGKRWKKIRLVQLDQENIKELKTKLRQDNLQAAKCINELEDFGKIIKKSLPVERSTYFLEKKVHNPFFFWVLSKVGNLFTKN